MNLRLFSMALLVSALPALAQAGVSFDKGDFTAARKITRDGQTVLRLKLSKSGKAKLRKLNRDGVGESVQIEIDGVESDLVFREPIAGDGVEVGPYSADDADRVAAVINK